MSGVWAQLLTWLRWPGPPPPIPAEITVMCPHCRDIFDAEDIAEEFVHISETGVVCGMCRKAGRLPR